MSQQQQQDESRQVLRRLRRVLDSDIFVEQQVSMQSYSFSCQSASQLCIEALGVCRELTLIRV
jgi:hypothetical protein